MDKISVTTHEVGAQHTVASSPKTEFENVGLIEHQPGFAPVRRRTLMAAVNTLAKTLGLRPASVMVLDALLSCLPCQDGKTGADRPVTPLTLLTVYASNETLCFRSKGIPERQLRRHLDRLEAVGLVARRDSSNGKRFPIKRGGKVVGAYGIDLSPLLARSSALIEAAERCRDEAAELRGLRAVILRLRLDCLSRPLSDAALSFVATVHKVLRRASLTLTEARVLLAKLSAILQNAPSEETAVMLTAANTSSPDAAADPNTAMPTAQSEDPVHAEPCADVPSRLLTAAQNSDQTATDGLNDRHKKTPKSYSKKTAASSEAAVWQRLRCLPAFYPDEPRDHYAMRRILFEVGKMLRIDDEKTTEAVTRIGLARTLEIMDQLADRPDEIAHPQAYLLQASASLSARVFDRSQEGGGKRATFTPYPKLGASGSHGLYASP